nr:28S ribosomal protein S9, mitochondrial [Tanacetum cinerariifolium]
MKILLCLLVILLNGKNFTSFKRSSILDLLAEKINSFQYLQDSKGAEALMVTFPARLIASSRKQEEIANARVRQVDGQGRAYGTRKRKCSIARVWIEPGEGKFLINDNQFDLYFLKLDQQAALLRPLTETKTLGLLDVNCTVKGVGVSGLKH